MKAPSFYPPVTYVAALRLDRALPLRGLCALAETPCQASGRWTERPVELADGPWAITATAASWGNVRITLPLTGHQRDDARQALCALAYGLHDLVARECVRGALWSRPRCPPGRRPSGQAMSAAERQMRFRCRR
jgi:hypothetical protein